MSNSLIPPQQPNQEGEAQGHTSADKPRRGGRRGAMLNEDDCHERLSLLPGLVTAKILTPAQANAIRASLNDILSHLRHRNAKPTSAQLSDADLASIRRTDPHVFNMLAQLLTDEQLDQILRDTDEKSDDQA